MSVDMMFGDTVVNEVNVSTQGGKRASRIMDNILSQPTDNGIGASLVEAGHLAKGIAAANDSKEANEAKTHYRQLLTSEGYVAASDTQKAEMWETFYGGVTDRSNAYQDALKGYSQGVYYNASTGREAELVTSGVNNSHAWVTSYLEKDSGEHSQGFGVEDGYAISNRDLGKTKSDAIDAYVQEFPYMRDSKFEIGQALLNEDYNTMIEMINNSTTPKELAEAYADTQDIEKDLQTNFLNNTKQKEAMQANNSRRTALSNSIKLKEAQFKQEAYKRQADAVEGGYRQIPAAVKGDIEYTSANALVAEKAYQTYVEKHDEVTQADTYNSTYAAGDRPAVLPDNDMLKEGRQQMVTTSLFNNFSSDNMKEFVRVADNEHTMTRDIGESILTQFNKAESIDDMNVIMNKLNTINAEPKGATILRQMFTDDEYVRMMSIKFMSQARPTEDLSTIRNYVDQQAQSVASISLDPTKTAKMFDKAVKLGTQGNAYINVMQGLMKINPQLAQAEMNNIYKTFEAQVGKKNGVKIDTSMATNPADGRDIIDPDAVDIAINKELPEGTTSKTFLPGNIVISQDSFDGTLSVIDVSKAIKDSEENTTATLLKEHEEEVAATKAIPKGERSISTVTSAAASGAKVAAKSFVRTAIDNSGALVTGAPEVIGDLLGNMTDRFQQHLWDSMGPAEQEFFKAWEPNRYEEVLMDVIEEEIEKRPTEMPGVTNMTMPDMDTAKVVSALEKNKWEKERLSQIADGMHKSVYYEGFTNAETGSFKNPWLRTTANKTPGGSTAFGPVQITKGLLKSVKKSSKEYNFSKEEEKAIDVFIKQADLFNKHGNNKGKIADYDKDFDYGGNGFFASEKYFTKAEQEVLKKQYQKVTTKIMRRFHKKHKGNKDKVISEWRFGHTYSVEKAMKEDKAYFKRFYKKQ